MRAAPSITRLFAATFIAVALVGLVTQVATWRSARATQAAMVSLTQRLDRLQRLNPSPSVAAEATAAADLAVDAGDDAVQAALAAGVLFAAMLVVLGLGFWYNRRRLAAPFSRIVQALQRVGEGQFVEPLPEDQPGEFGTIARGVNHMAKSLAWREELQAYLSQLLAALNTSADDAATGLAQALGVIAGSTKATGIVLYQPAYDSNEWAPSTARGLESRPVSRATMRDLMGDATQAIHYHGEAVQAVRHQLRLAVPMPQGLVLVPLRAGTKLVGVLGVVPGTTFGPDERAALDQAAPNLAIACERGSAHQNTRRLAVEVRQTAKRLEQLNTELDGAMKSKDQFLSNISHELRTPLNSIIGFTDLLLTQELGPPLSDKQRDFLETVARNGRHLLELINELLDLQRIAAGRMDLKPEPVELAGLLNEAVGSVDAQVQKHHHALVVTPPPEGLRVQADRVRVRQVLLNLLSNAIKFTPDGGRITVAAGPVNGGSEVRIAVTDTGIGIATEDQPKLFQEFSQLDASASRKYEGTGLGLALSRRLIELHGGTIGVESQMGKGSTFWFTLPQAR
ncbi:MAG TPA: ATP-binding protein [Gemmatimonadales bacterium]|jgi:signal transduction histidine kinase/HAMP domain-containing protein|nr:ATP-binding protein [Gemmatimonadales bacterium]